MLRESSFASFLFPNPGHETLFLKTKEKRSPRWQHERVKSNSMLKIYDRRKEKRWKVRLFARVDRELIEKGAGRRNRVFNFS